MSRSHFFRGTRRPYLVGTLGLALVALVAAACVSGPTATTPVPTPTAVPTPTPTPSSTPEATLAFSENLFLTISEPEPESVINAETVLVKGQTTPDALVSINGALTEVDALGNFLSTIDLEVGPNLIEVVVSDLEGAEENGILAVIYIP